MKKVFFIFGMVFFSALHARETESTTMARSQIRAFLQETEELFAAEDDQKLADAAARFRALLEQTPEGEMNQDALRLAEGMAKLKAGDAEGALKVLDEIEGFEDPQIRGQLRQMKGNAQMKLAETAWAAKEWETAKKEMGNAIESYTNALRENAKMDAARHNLELAQKRLLEIKEQEPPPPEDQEKQDDQEKKDDQEKQDQQDDQKDKGDQQQDQQKQDQPDEQDPSEEEDQSDKDNQEKPEDQQEKQDQSRQEDQEQNQEEKPGQAGSEGEESGDEKLDAMQARQLLDAALEQEKAQRRLIQQQRVRVVPVEKDW